MLLHRLEIHNYKSLRNVAIEPTPLSVFVGPNAAGKTNLADALDFLGHAYAWGLEKAVRYKGGYENICFRAERPASDPIQFRVACKIAGNSELFPNDLEARDIEHYFELRPNSRGAAASYKLENEKLVDLSSAGGGFRSTYQLRERVFRKGLVSEDEFVLPHLGRWERGFAKSFGSLRVFQLDPRSCRESGIPSPNPDLDRSGRNLPVALDHLKKEHPEEFARVLDMARRVMPTLEDIETGWTHTRSLALFLRERGVLQPWTSEDVSVGTLQTIALLVAAFDPGTPLVVIEEPENSVHPWALRTLAEAFRLASEKKQILLTTHSPILIDQLKPEEVWVVRKPGTETKIDPLLSLDPSLKESWGQGKFTLSEYLDSGAVPEAVPAAGS